MTLNRNIKAWLLLIPAFLPIFLVLVIGLFDTIMASLGWLPILNQTTLSLDAYSSLLMNTEILKSTAYTIAIAIISATLAVFIGSLSAWCLIQVNKKWVYILGLIVSSFGVILPYAVVAQSTQLLFSQSGLLARFLYHIGLLQDQVGFPTLLNTPFSLGLFWPFIVKGSAFMMIVILPIYREIKVSQEAEAKTLGAKGVNLWLRIYHASAARPISFVAGIMFAFTFGGIEIPLWLGALKPRMLSIHYYTLFQHPDLNLLSQRMALVVFMAVIGLVATIIYSHLLYRVSQKMKLPVSHRHRHIKFYPKLHNRMIVLYSSMIVVPILWLVYRGVFSPIYYPDLLPSSWQGVQAFVDAFGEPLLRKAMTNSTIVSVMTGLYISLAAIPAGRAFSKYKDFSGRRLAIFLCAVPLIIPAIVIITGTVQGTIKFGLYGTHIAVALCHVVMTLPYAIGIQSTYQKQLGNDLELSARTLGASAWQYFYKVHLPLIIPPFVLSFSLGFLISFTETFSTQLVGAGRIVTLGALMAPTLEFGDITRGSAYMVIFLAINGFLFAASNKYAKKWTRKSQAELKLEEQLDRH